MNKLVPALAILLLSSPVFAQSGSTQVPPSPNAGESAPQPSSSAPPGATNMNTNSTSNPNVSGPVGTTVVTPNAVPAPMTAAPAVPAVPQPLANTVPAPASR